MLFQRKSRRVSRILVVEDEALVAFDNETMLQAAGYEVVGAVDNVADALTLIGRGGIDLVLTDIRINGDGSGLDVARAASAAAIPVLLAAGACPKEVDGCALGCLMKPFTAHGLRMAVETVERLLDGRVVRRLSTGFSLYPGALEGARNRAGLDREVG